MSKKYGADAYNNLPCIDVGMKLNSVLPSSYKWLT